MRLLLGCILGAALALSSATPRANAAGSDGSPAKKATDSSSNATSESPAKAEAEPAKSSLESEIEELRDLMLTQAQQLQAQSEQLKQQQQKMQMLEEQLKAETSAPAKLAVAPTAPPAAASAIPNPIIPASASSGSVAVASAVAPARLPPQQAQKTETAPPSPLSFNIGSAKFTPSGFMDLTNFFRSKDIGSGIGTTFSSVPFNNSLPLAALTEDHFSIQNSRIALRVDSNVAGGDVVGYVEADFLGFTNDNLNVTSNSNTLRSRLYFIDYRKGRIELFGGQDWSMLTPNRNGIGFMPADIFNTQDMDTNYNVGLTWERTAQFRLIFHPSNTVAFGVSIENPQQYIGSAITFPTAATPTIFTATQVNTGTSLNSTALGSSPTATNSLATPDVHPDVIAKIAFDPKITNHGIHIEALGLFRTFRINTTNGAVNLGNTTIHGGAGAINSNFEIFKNFKIFETAYYSSGGGREIGSTNVPDFIVLPALTGASKFGLSQVHSDAGIAGLEWQVTPKTMFYGYWGDVYIGRNFSLSGCGATGTSPCGYGFSGSPNTNDRTVQEDTFGWIQTFWRNPNYGALSLITQASYLTRSPWFVAAGAPRTAHAGMAYIDLRYTLP
jgi:hypothetical protein